MIPVNEPLIGEAEISYVMEAVQSGWISSAGKYINAFEQAWAAYCGRKNGVAVANGTVALEMAVKALSLQPGDEVILPSFTIISCAQAVVYAGAIPVLVDVDPETWCMDVNQIEQKITPKTRAIMPVHIYGHPVDMDPVLKLADQYGLAVIEDAAEAHGAAYLTNRSDEKSAWRKCGSFGTMSCFSFYANKIITTGEGGMVLTDDSDLAERLRSLRNLCFRPDRRFYHTELGNNFRITNLQAAIGLGQVEKIETTLAHKKWLGKSYTGLLSGLRGIQLPVEKIWAKNVYWMYGVVLDVDTGLNAVAFAHHLEDLGIMTRPFFLGMHEQPAFHQMNMFLGESYPVTEHLSRQGLYLPSGAALTETQLEQVVNAVKITLGRI